MSEYGAPPPPPPPPYGAMPPGQPMGGQPPPNYLVWSILTTLFCCLPLGVASIVFSSQVSNKWAMGDIGGAQESSRKAKQFAIWAAIGGVISTVLSFVLVVVIGIGASKTNGN